MSDFFNIITIISAVLMVIFILIQTRGSSLGEAFGGDSAVYHSRRGVELVVYQLTIIFAVIFVLSIIFSLLTA